MIKVWDEIPPTICPYCRQPMELLQEGGFPAGYPRMETPHSDEAGDHRGEAAMGRTRKIE